jgi:hypothetical protein
MTDFTTVRWIHEHGFPGPILNQAIVGTRKVSLALRVIVCGAWVQSEMKLVIELVKEPLGRGPLFGCRGKMNA